jgi:saccharopine dehydrogenase-like NADP-dependent oxidoreductase
LLEAATDFLKVFNLSATVGRQGGWVQLEQSDMRLAWNMAKMAKGGFSGTAKEETQYLIKKPWTKVREELKRTVEFPGHNEAKAAIKRHPAMLRQNNAAGYHSCQMVPP